MSNVDGEVMDWHNAYANDYSAADPDYGGGAVDMIPDTAAQSYADAFHPQLATTDGTDAWC